MDKNDIEHDILKSYGQIRTNLGGQVECVMRTKCFDFVEDPDPDTIMFFLSDSSPLRNGPKNDAEHDISKSCGHVTNLGG